MTVNEVGFVFNPHVSEAARLADHLAQEIGSHGWDAWCCSAWDEAQTTARVGSSYALVALGGDGTILRAARVAAPVGVPIVGVNLGRLGFLSELTAAESPVGLVGILSGERWVEARTMLSATMGAEQSASDEAEPSRFLALNDVVVARGANCRSIRVRTEIAGCCVATYRGDGVVVASATGSTAYSLAAGGPVLHPEMDNLVVTPLLTHLKLAPPLVLPAGAEIRLTAVFDQSAMLSLDGQIDLALRSGASVTVQAAAFKALFWRRRDRQYFYRGLGERLGW